MLSSDHSKPAMNPTGKLLLPLLSLLAATTAFPLATRGAAPAELGSSPTDMVVGCLPWERDALLAFKRGINSDPLGLLASWRQDGGGGDHDCCRWRGVGCSNLTGHVVELQLNGAYVDERVGTQGLVGEISPQLLKLDRIEHLDLSINFLQGPSGRIPEFLGSMKSLRYLSLSDIPFTGAVTPQLGNLSRLEHLDLSYLVGTHLTDLSWLSRLGSLEYLDLTSVDLSMASDWAHAVNMIPSIRVLHLCDCQIQSADQSLTHLNLTKIEELDLSSNHINHSYASCWFWNSTSLQFLDISFNSLNVELPDALGEMTSLRVLNITHNYYTDIVAPGSLRRLYSLEILNIESCYLSANMTELLEILSHGSKKLRQLKMAMNDISGTLPAGILQQFADLDILDFRNNNLTGHVPTEIGMLTSLTYMDLSHNNLAGVITEEHFASLKRLKYMDLSYNPLMRIAVDPGWIAPFRLQHACFASCQMGPQFPSWLQGQMDITYFDISNAGITDKLPDRFWTTFSKAKYLDFSNNGISGALPTNMENMPMEYLQLGSNQISGQIPPLPRNIKLLDVSNNSLRGPLPSELIGAQNQMEVLILSSNKLSGRIPRSLCRMQYLHTLDLANNLFGGDFPPCFGMRNVEVLLLSNNRFSGTFPAFLERCTQLLVIDLSRNNFSGKLPMWIGDKEKLLFLRVSYNVFSGFIPANFTNLKNLCHLDLASNNLSGNIPWGLSNLLAMKQESSIVFQIYIPEEYYSSLSVVTKRQELYYGSTILDIASIDFSSNYLIGAIPGEIASLALLKNLNLSRNYLSGKIPYKIGSLQSLESLDLSRNKLSGEIPLSLTNLSYLGDLDLSHNNLSGRIPSGSQLDTLYMEHPDMYNDNSGLCGPPLQRNCLGGIAPKQHGYGGHKETAHVPEPMFFYLGLVSGFIVGLWAVFCIILFKKTWRIAYFRYFDNVYDKIYVLTVVTWASLSHKMTAQ